MFKRLLNLFRQRHLEEELRDEFETHLAAIEKEELANGATPEEARRRARMRFGNAGVYQESTRDADLVVWLDDSWRDLKIAVRQLRRSPTFALSAVLLLGLGIGVKIPMNRNFGIKLEERGFFTFLDSGGHSHNNGCYSCYDYGHELSQGETNFGMYFRF